MKNNRILRILTVFFGVLSLLLSFYPAKAFINNYFANYEKEVYLGGDNIVINLASSSNNNEVTISKDLLTVGTLTYIDLDNNYAAVAHNLNNARNSGNIFILPVYNVVKSRNNFVGEKDVIINFRRASGSIDKIDSSGVYGEYFDDTSIKQKVSFGMPNSIKKGEAYIYTNIDGNIVKSYKISIVDVNYARDDHNIHFKVIDEELISKTGGIIAGMSGSPIVQDGKIIGSLSHVEESDPIYGYGLFITSMEG